MTKTRENIWLTREILDKYINLDNTCLTKAEKKEVRDLVYKYKDTFSLRDEIGTCPNIEVEIDMTDKSPFFIRPFHTKEEDTNHSRQGNEKVMLSRYTKRRFFCFTLAQLCL